MSQAALSLEALLHRAIQQNQDEVKLLLEYLKISEKVQLSQPAQSMANAKLIADELRKAGSNSIATVARRGEGVTYEEIAYDTAKQLKIKGVQKSDNILDLEEKILQKTFQKTLEKMSGDERLAVLREAGLSDVDIPKAAMASLIVPMLVTKFGAAWMFKVSALSTKFLTSVLISRGATAWGVSVFAKTLGAFAGPVGWGVASGWVLFELAGPAYRKVIPAMILVATIRQRAMKEINIAVVGDGSVGKDSLFREVFNIDTSNINPIAGSTSNVETYEYDEAQSIKLLNFPGFNDYREGVNEQTDDVLPLTDVFLCVVDVNRGVSQTDIDIVNMIESFNKPLLICLNKLDLLRPNQKQQVLNETKERLGQHEYIECVFDPHPNLTEQGPAGGDEVFNWVTEALERKGKDTTVFVETRANKRECCVDAE